MINKNMEHKHEFEIRANTEYCKVCRKIRIPNTDEVYPDKYENIPNARGLMEAMRHVK
jgi:hypothetical protein